MMHQSTDPSSTCDHGSYWTDEAGNQHCLTCSHVTQSTDGES